MTNFGSHIRMPGYTDEFINEHAINLGSIHFARYYDDSYCDFYQILNDLSRLKSIQVFSKGSIDQFRMCILLAKVNKEYLKYIVKFLENEEREYNKFQIDTSILITLTMLNNLICSVENLISDYQSENEK